MRLGKKTNKFGKLLAIIPAKRKRRSIKGSTGRHFNHEGEMESNIDSVRPQKKRRKHNEHIPPWACVPEPRQPAKKGFFQEEKKEDDVEDDVFRVPKPVLCGSSNPILQQLSVTGYTEHFGQIGFAKWGKQQLPMKVVNPFDNNLPENVHKKWMHCFGKVR